MWIISVYGFQIPLHPIQPIVSVLSCILGIKIISKKLIYNFREDIPFLIIAGIIGSILNGLFNSLLMNNTILSIQVLSFIIGDVLGQIGSFSVILSHIKIYKFI
jgi:hypothetical protein